MPVIVIARHAGISRSTLLRRLGGSRAALDEAVRAQLTSGPARMAIEHAGADATAAAIAGAYDGNRQPDGTYVQHNVFRYVIGRA